MKLQLWVRVFIVVVMMQKQSPILLCRLPPHSVQPGFSLKVSQLTNVVDSGGDGATTRLEDSAINETWSLSLPNSLRSLMRQHKGESGKVHRTCDNNL